MDDLTARLEKTQSLLAGFEKALRFYARASNWDRECDGMTPVPDTSEAEYDGGRRARYALALLTADGGAVSETP